MAKPLFFDHPVDTNPDLTYAQRVAAGVTVLTSYLAPPACLAGIDLDRLDMASYTGDLLGQIYGNTAEGMAVLDLTEAEAWGLGFVALDGDDDQLTEAWFTVLLAMRAAPLPRRPVVAEEVAA